MSTRLSRLFAPENRDRGAGIIEYAIVVLIAIALAVAMFQPLRAFVTSLVSGLQVPSFG